MQKIVVNQNQKRRKRKMDDLQELCFTFSLFIGLIAIGILITPYFWGLAMGLLFIERITLIKEANKKVDESGMSKGSLDKSKLLEWLEYRSKSQLKTCTKFNDNSMGDRFTESSFILSQIKQGVFDLHKEAKKKSPTREANTKAIASKQSPKLAKARKQKEVKKK